MCCFSQLVQQSIRMVWARYCTSFFFFVLCLDKLHLESLYWACNLGHNIVTCWFLYFEYSWWLLASQVETSVCLCFFFFFKSKIFGESTLSYTLKKKKKRLLWVVISHRGVCAICNCYIETESKWVQFPSLISGLCTNDFRKHWWTTFIVRIIDPFPPPPPHTHFYLNICVALTL